MARLGRAQTFKPALPIISDEWYAYLAPKFTTANAGIAVANGVAPPQPFKLRADAVAIAYAPTGGVVMSPAAATATATVQSPSGSVLPIAILAVSTGTAFNTSHPLTWTTADAILWTSGEIMEWTTS